MLIRTVIIFILLSAGCASTNQDKTVTPDTLPGMEKIEIPGAGDISTVLTSTLPPEEPDQSYKLMAGDLISIQVYDQPQLSMEFRIPKEGDVNYSAIGKVQLIDRTIEEVEADIKSRLEKKVLNRAQVTILIKNYNKRSMFILGKVNHSGSYDIPFGKGLSLLQAVSLAGGFSTDADKDNMLLIRRYKDKRTAYRIVYSEIIKGGKLENDVALKDGDVLLVKELSKVYVLGKVNNPGGFSVPVDQNITLTKVISLANGFNPLAAQGKTTLIRALPDGKTQIFRIDVGQIFSGAIRDPVLLPGDIVFVPESFF